MTVLPLKLYTTIKPELRRKHIFRGTAIGSIGIFFLIICGAFIPPKILEEWGLFILLVGGTLIGIGMLPARRLARLEVNPDILSITEKEDLEFFSDKQLILSIPLDAIEKTTYLEDANSYGILVNIKQGCKVHLFISPRAAKIYIRGSHALYFPFFSERSCKELQEVY